MKKHEPLIYVPPDAKINLENKNIKPTETEYESRRATFDVDAVKNLTKGKYGKKKE